MCTFCGNRHCVQDLSAIQRSLQQFPDIYIAPERLARVADNSGCSIGSLSVYQVQPNLSLAFFIQLWKIKGEMNAGLQRLINDADSIGGEYKDT